MHGRSFVAGLPLEILVCNRPDALVSVNLKPYRFLDSYQTRQSNPTLFYLGILQHKCCLEVSAVRNERIVGVQFFLNLIGFKDAFDAEHFLHLVLHGQSILKVERRVRSDLNPPVGFVRQNVGPKVQPFPGIDFERKKVTS